jgi:hypothetical protein
VSRGWEITIGAPCEWLTANDRLDRWEKAHRVRLWRTAAYVHAVKAKLPTGLDRVKIVAVARFAGRPPVRDVENLAPTVKAVVDGLGPRRETHRAGGEVIVSVGYGLVPDDSDKHVDGPYLSIGEPLPRRAYGQSGHLRIKILEVVRA